ncbi:MAG: hypothetical protein E2O38_16860 [Proteobacteria bacterium]|nr:MAG: hypothetical protein E2O38_16860 [Pseudomonadota bacterium]
MPGTETLKQPKQLIVEGKDDKIFFIYFLEHLRVDDIQVQVYEGKDNLGPFLKALLLTPGYDQCEVLGIVRDADDDPQAAFNSARTALQSAGLPEPPAPEMSTGDSPRVSVLILPNGNTAGMLESLCYAAVADDPVVPCVDEFLSCVQERIDGPNPLPKAQVGAFLATRESPGLQLGHGARKGYWPWHSPTFQHVREFLTSL